jgi:hypothetical protein
VWIVQRDDNRTLGQPAIPGSTIDLQRQRAAQAQQIPEVPLDIEVNYPQASSAPAGNSFSGQWKVLVNGEEVWRFRGVGNSQADANRLAAQWLRDNGMGVSGEGYEVLPVMVEGLTESNQLHLRDFTVIVSPHALERCYNRNVSPAQVDNILKNIDQAKNSIMGQPPHAPFILHDGQGTALGMRRLPGRQLTLATVYNVPEDFVKGKYPTFQVDINQ